MIWTSPIFRNRFNFQETISFYELFKLLPHCPASGRVIFFSSCLCSSYRSLSDIRTLSWLLYPPLILCVIIYNYILYKLIQCVNVGNIRAPLRNFACRSYLYRHLSVLTETTNRIGKIDNDRILIILLLIILFYRRNIFITNFTHYDLGKIHFRTYRYEMIDSSTVYKQCFIVALLDTDRIHRFAIYKDTRTSIFVRESMHI